jgi:hypothetical protein
MTICVMSNFHQLTLKPVDINNINNSSIKTVFPLRYLNSDITLIY